MCFQFLFLKRCGSNYIDSQNYASGDKADKKTTYDITVP